jgi:hypothetical protein
MRAGRWQEADANGSIAPGRGAISVACISEAVTVRRCRMAGGTVKSRKALTMDLRRREPERGKPMHPGRPTTALSPLIFPAMLVASVAQ